VKTANAADAALEQCLGDEAMNAGARSRALIDATMRRAFHSCPSFSMTGEYAHMTGEFAHMMGEYA
jgi:hypothetical protein